MAYEQAHANPPFQLRKLLCLLVDVFLYLIRGHKVRVVSCSLTVLLLMCWLHQSNSLIITVKTNAGTSESNPTEPLAQASETPSSVTTKTPPGDAKSPSRLFPNLSVTNILPSPHVADATTRKVIGTTPSGRGKKQKITMKRPPTNAIDFEDSSDVWCCGIFWQLLCLHESRMFFSCSLCLYLQRMRPVLSECGLQNIRRNESVNKGDEIHVLNNS